MIDSMQSIQKAIAERNYSASMHLFDHALQEGRISELIQNLEEIDQAVSLRTLEFRDHIFYYLGMWDIYYAVQISSIDTLKILHENNVANDVQIFMVHFIRGFLESFDSRFDQFCVNIDTISAGQYAILLPTILERRSDELEKCKIQYRQGPNPQYCTADLLSTYYGKKIVSATQERRIFDIVVNEEMFRIIEESLSSTGLDVSSMLEEVDSDSWEEFVANKRKPGSHHSEIGELTILHRVKSARSNIYANNFRQQVAALNAIVLAKTQLCNDVLMNVVSNNNHQMRRRALKQLGESGDTGTMEFLAGIMKNDIDESIRTEAARAYSVLASRSKLSSIAHTIPPPMTKSPILDISKINRIINTLLAKGMPSTMIDDTLSAIAIQGGPDSVGILTQLLAKPQVSVRSAVIKASRSLDTETAAPIIRAALNDESPDIVAMAENELDTRWPDAIWD